MSAPGRAVAGRHPLSARVRELALDLGVELALEAPLGPLTWLGIGGETPFLLTPRRTEPVPALVATLASMGLRPRWLGAGSNLLVDDRGIEEPVVVTSGLRGEPAIAADGLVRVAGGAPLPGFARWLAGRSLSGLEFAEGIPGSVGGSVAMNAGAFDRSLGERAARVSLVHPDGRLEERAVRPGDFSYRRSAFAEAETLVIEAAFRLDPAEPAELARRLEEFRRYRRDTQPLSEQSAGCIFRNPTSGPSAGALIERCGLKGLRRGGAEVSRVHANFVINAARASFADVRALVEEVKGRVRKEAGVLLVEEIRVWTRS